MALQSRYRVVNRDSIAAARSRVAVAQGDFERAVLEHRLARSTLAQIPRWRVWAHWSASADVKDCSLAVTHASLEVTKAKARAWDTFERTQAT